ncbi:hypothetical protein AZI86_05655 [Bdellovibrio bacteriovorus]|uniref:Uncharacterized protein n=1 Tax=Bdellovibrio bacteriovorus TaxID=959 RepID=A0A150WQ26_BDEBC|nr:hypothetical protein [Bdellovibrio bacteriovorus]KYG66530.1 hypothetical protein AZI86_05655 [Bdellovibrio bacteriovorus]
MHKILGIIAVAVNCFAWLGTFESSRAAAYRARPEIAAVLKKQEAEKLIEEKRSESAALVGETVPHQAPAVTDEKLLTDNAIISGEVMAEANAQEYHYTMDIRFWKTAPDSIDPGKWKAQVVFMNLENLYVVTVFKADPIVQDGVITLNLEETDKSKAFNDYNSTDVLRYVRKVVLTVDANGTIRAGAEDDAGVKWKSRVERINPSAYEGLMGTWKGKFANNVPAKITLHEEGGQVVGEMLYQHSVGACKGKLKGLFRPGGQIVLLGAPINEHTACISNYVLKIKNHENQLVGGYYDYQTREGAEEFKFSR